MSLVALSDPQFAVGMFGLVILTALILRRSLHAKLGSIEVTLGSIDKAVNNRPKGDPTISEEVSQIRAEVQQIVHTQSARHTQNVDRIDRLTGELHGLQEVVRRDRHAARNSFAALLNSVNDSVRGAFAEHVMTPSIEVERVTWSATKVAGAEQPPKETQ